MRLITNYDLENDAPGTITVLYVGSIVKFRIVPLISDRYELIAVDETGQQTGIDCCSSIDECLKLIEKIEEAFDDESGVLDLRVD